MHKYAAPAALNITMLALAVSASLTPANARGEFGEIDAKTGLPTNEGQCDYWGARWGIGCHCRFECYRKYSYVVRVPCPSAFGPRRLAALGQDATLCKRTIAPVETIAACHRTCVKAKRVSPGAAPAPNWRSTLALRGNPAQH
jgi:hypothetical protein